MNSSRNSDLDYLMINAGLCDHESIFKFSKRLQQMMEGHELSHKQVSQFF